MQELVSVYPASGNELLGEVSREEARAMKAAGTHFFINHGKALRQVARCVEVFTELEQELGWFPKGKLLKASVLCQGRVGQFTIGYPIPYAFEGHLRMPRASVVNYQP